MSTDISNTSISSKPSVSKSMCSEYDIDLPCDECCMKSSDEEAKQISDREECSSDIQCKSSNNKTTKSSTTFTEQQSREVDDYYKTNFGNVDADLLYNAGDYECSQEAEKRRQLALKPYTLPHGSSLIVEQQQRVQIPACNVRAGTNNGGGGGGAGNNTQAYNPATHSQCAFQSNDTPSSSSRTNNLNYNNADDTVTTRTTSKRAIHYFSPQQQQSSSSAMTYRQQQQQQQQQLSEHCNRQYNPVDNCRLFATTSQNQQQQNSVHFSLSSQSPTMNNDPFFNANLRQQEQTQSANGGKSSATSPSVPSNSSTPVLSALLNSAPASAIAQAPAIPTTSIATTSQNNVWYTALYNSLLNQYTQQQQQQGLAATLLQTGASNNLYPYLPLSAVYNHHQQSQHQQPQQQLFTEQQQREYNAALSSALYGQMLLQHQQQQQQQQQQQYYLQAYGVAASQQQSAFSSPAAVNRAAESTAGSPAMKSRDKNSKSKVPVSAIATAAYHQHVKQEARPVNSPSALLSPPSIPHSPQDKDTYQTAPSSSSGVFDPVSASTTPTNGSRVSYSPSVASNPTASSSSQLHYPVRRSVTTLPASATEILREWFALHNHNPYPTKPERQEISAITGLKEQQISAWFANARRRQKSEQDAAATNKRKNNNQPYCYNAPHQQQQQQQPQPFLLQQQFPNVSSLAHLPPQTNETLIGSGQIIATSGGGTTRRGRSRGGGRGYYQQQPTSSMHNDSSLQMLANAAAVVGGRDDGQYYGCVKREP